jgi:hypothetical protein
MTARMRTCKRGIKDKGAGKREKSQSQRSLSGASRIVDRRTHRRPTGIEEAGRSEAYLITFDFLC